MSQQQNNNRNRILNFEKKLFELISSLDSIAISKKMGSYAIALCVSVGLSFSLLISVIDKDFESKKEVLDLMYLQEKMHMSGDEFINNASKEGGQKYCSTLSNLDDQKTCRLTLYKNHEIDWLTNKVSAYIAFASILSMFFSSAAFYGFIRRSFHASRFCSFVISAVLFFSLLFYFISFINSKP